MTVSRRDFLAAAIGGSLGAFHNLQFNNSGMRTDAESCQLIPRWSPPLALETPIAGATTWITPIECFYVFDHAALSHVNSQSWNVTISGEVERPLRLSLAELQRLEQADVTNTLECAGNGRALFTPTVSGIQWQRGAVGNATFRGPRLAALLASAKIGSKAKHVAFSGIDVSSQSNPRFIRSVPIKKALDPNTILATTMNGQPLSQEHGFPIRAVVPGWIGAASVKRVSQISILSHEADGEFMQRGYRLPINTKDGTTAHPAASVALTSLRVKSMITRVSMPRVSLLPITISGAAWAGDSGISRVDVSTDAGENWDATELHRHNHKYAWTFWDYTWVPQKKGQFRISVKATDTDGRTQPETPAWNPRGYMWNGIDHVQVTVE
jgi:DMSO/TMAO reductase YedYZ molybdopterin-dependent catalytic subunit